MDNAGWDSVAWEQYSWSSWNDPGKMYYHTCFLFPFSLSSSFTLQNFPIWFSFFLLVIPRSLAYFVNLWVTLVCCRCSWVTVVVMILMEMSFLDWSTCPERSDLVLTITKKLVPWMPWWVTNTGNHFLCTATTTTITHIDQFSFISSPLDVLV